MAASGKSGGRESRPQPKRELKAQKRSLKQEEREKIERAKRLKKLFYVGLAVFIVAAVVSVAAWYFASKSSSPGTKIVSKTGIHWHAWIKITILGESQDVPAGVGLSPSEKPVHTHTADGLVHLEFPSFVMKNDIRLGRFFEYWGKTFNSTCIFDKCSGPEGKLKMSVNGSPNFEFENYIIRDGDKIEIAFER